MSSKADIAAFPLYSLMSEVDDIEYIGLNGGNTNEIGKPGLDPELWSEIAIHKLLD